ncbi:U11/U12 small nuclear ribonucleoprotein 31 kDa protein [Humulus lupulus]|uniref:U11/U12 small nuclear ribonucleoprotein 31 kDa protein n=1 Tax=Humulus lupulus TaxID=3486 RepID=UPI002B4167B3|nr:U11/U12 small nuclear ribonucleoprotein 31 kDa protein [Humulus lupulus]XP_062091995.1 U11/U12 small nuclear ribonucleoprotein 31 kDa protein [Humulus lupulus]
MAKKNKKRGDSDEDDDETFYYRYASAPTTGNHPSRTSGSGSKPSGSGALAPSKSTLYVSNIDYSLTNSDLHTLFSTFGKVARVSVLKDRQTRLSRGVAFVQFVSRNDAVSAARQMHGKVLNGRTLTASIAADNGRASEFIRKRVYRDKSRCYECGAEGHLSYECPRNQLGPRERPPPKKLRRGGDNLKREDEEDNEAGWSDGAVEVFEDDNWASVVDSGADERLLREGSGGEGGEEEKKKKKLKKASYFSDESGDEDD